MPMFERSEPTDIEVIDRWEGGVGWLAHPEESGQRTSHAIAGEDGVWLFDPLDGPGVDELLDGLGTVAGIAVCSQFHARDADAFAERYDVPVAVPAWMDRVAKRLDAPVERYRAPPGEWATLGESDISVRTVNPRTAWREMIAYRPANGTLRVPDILSTVSPSTVGDERLGCYLVHRLAPPREAFADVEPERVLVGHGEGVFEDADAALDHSLAVARRHLPRALVTQAPMQIRGVIEGFRD